MKKQRTSTMKAWLTLGVAALAVCVVMAGLALPIFLCGGDPAAQQAAMVITI